MSSADREQTTRELLAEYAMLLGKFGVDSEEADEFLDAHKENEEFIELASLSKTLKKALTAPTQGCASDSSASR